LLDAEVTGALTQGNDVGSPELREVLLAILEDPQLPSVNSFCELLLLSARVRSSASRCRL